MFSAVDGQFGAREPDLGAGRLSFLSAFSHMECEVLVCRRPKLSLPFLPAGVGCARGPGGGGCAGCLLAESGMPYGRLSCVFIISKAKLKEFSRGAGGHAPHTSGSQ